MTTSKNWTKAETRKRQREWARRSNTKHTAEHKARGEITVTRWVPRVMKNQAESLLDIMCRLPAGAKGVPFLLCLEDDGISIVTQEGMSPAESAQEMRGWVLAFLARSVARATGQSCSQCQNLTEEVDGDSESAYCYLYSRDGKALSELDFELRWGWRRELIEHADCCPEGAICPYFAKK